MREETMATQLNNTLSVKREAPKPRSFSKPYWDATREKKLLIQYCRKTGQYQFFPRATSLFTATVTLDVGVNVLGNVVNCSPDEMRIGLKVKPFWAPLPNGTHLLMFEPDRAA